MPKKPSPSPMSPETDEDLIEAQRRIKACLQHGKRGKSLDLSFLGLSRLPSEIGQLSALTELYLQGNELSNLPPEIGQLSALTDLWLEKNKLSSLPPEIGQFSKLTRLRLYNNQLSSLPPEIGQLSQLTELWLHNNQLSSLPPEIGQFSQLTELWLSNNQLSSLPPEIGQLSQLTQLRLYNNQLSSLPPEIGQLSKLTQLWLSNNPLGSLPPEIRQLSRLTHLSLANAQLNHPPAEIGQLSQLKLLRLDENQLSSLPPEIGLLTTLTELYLHDNPNLEIPLELLGPRWEEVANGKAKPAEPRAILDHYLARQAQGERPLNEVRLVLVGRGGAGKTSLVQQLVNGTFDPGQGETPGVALSDWAMPSCTGGPVIAHVWDFAGQVITHSMHRYFLSHRTVYVLVLTQREDSAGEDADYWLKLIQSYGMEKQADGSGAGPPVLIALNKWDAAAVRVDRGALRERYPFITAFVETDCSTGRGIEDLRRKLCRLMDDPTVKPWVRQGYPRQWWQVKEKLRQRQEIEPHMSFAAFRQVCESCAVHDHEAVGRDLHYLGLALNYGLDPQWKQHLADLTVLRPSWVTHHCYRLIRHAEKQDGMLPCEALAAVLSVESEGVLGEPDGQMHLYLMRLMERFEVAYPLGETWPPGSWLVPLGLPDSQPEGVELFGRAPAADAMRLHYGYPSVPPGLLAQFMVRTHPLMEPGMQWARGTVLTLSGARALVRATSKTEVEVTALGANLDARRDLAGLCREELRSLHGQISGLDVRERTEVIADGEIVWMRVRTLEQDELKGKSRSGVETDVGTLEVETSKELDEFGTEEARLPEAARSGMVTGLDEIFGEMEGRALTRRSRPKPRLFISYSHTDEKHRKTLELYLKVLKIQGLIHQVWHDRCIQAGMEWNREIQTQLARADVLLFLTSTAALASDYIHSEELAPALQRHLDGTAVIVPIILERCDWVDTFAASPAFQGVKQAQRRLPQGLPRDGKAIRAFRPQNDGWQQVSDGLKKLLTEIKAALGKE